jgi:hypothetical protein
MKCDRFVSSIYFTRWDWFFSLSRFLFYHLTCLRFSVESFCLWFFLRFLSSFLNCLSFIDCRLDHCEIIISHYFFSLTITMRWSWDDRRWKENCWREKHRLSCAMLRPRLWIEKEWKDAKILKAEIEFRAKKRRFDVVLKRFEIRFVHLNVYDLFCRSFSKRNDFVFIENDEKRFWLWKLRVLELIWQRRRDWRSEFRRRRFLELTEHSRRDNSEDRVLELIEKLRRDRRKNKRLNRDESMRRRWKREKKRKKL